MVLKPEQERVRNLLTDTVTLLCKNGLSYSKEMKVQGLLGITLDEDDVFVVHIDEKFEDLLSAAKDLADGAIDFPEALDLEKDSVDSGSKKRRRRRGSRDSDVGSPSGNGSTPSKRNRQSTSQDSSQLVNVKQEQSEEVICLEEPDDIAIKPDPLRDSSYQGYGSQTLQQQTQPYSSAGMAQTAVRNVTGQMGSDNSNTSWDSSAMQQQQMSFEGGGGGTSANASWNQGASQAGNSSTPPKGTIIQASESEPERLLEHVDYALKSSPKSPLNLSAKPTLGMSSDFSDLAHAWGLTSPLKLSSQLPTQVSPINLQKQQLLPCHSLPSPAKMPQVALTGVMTPRTCDVEKSLTPSSQLPSMSKPTKEKQKSKNCASNTNARVTPTCSAKNVPPNLPPIMDTPLASNPPLTMNFGGSVPPPTLGFDHAAAMMAGMFANSRPRRPVESTEKKNICDYPGCEKKFWQKQTMRRHQREKHRDWLDEQDKGKKGDKYTGDLTWAFYETGEAALVDDSGGEGADDVKGETGKFGMAVT